MTTTNKYKMDVTDYGTVNWDALLASMVEDVDRYLHTFLSGPTDELLLAGENLALGEAVYVHSDGSMKKAKADAAATMPCLGVATAAILNGAAGQVQRVGPLVNAAWSWTIGGCIYISAATAGLLTQTRPSTNAQCIGVALSATCIFLAVGDTVTDHATRIASPNINRLLKEDTNGDLAEAAKLSEDTNGNLSQLNTGSAPSSSPTDGYYLYSDDQAAGNACPHVRTEAGQVVKLYQEAGADQAAVGALSTPGNADNEIGGLTLSDPPTQSEVQALRDKAEELADDFRNDHTSLGSVVTLLNEIRRCLVANGLMKGSA